jgi:hypothetical protein
MVLCRLRMVSYVNKYDVDVRKLVFFVLWAVWAKIGVLLGGLSSESESTPTGERGGPQPRAVCRV